MFSRRRSDLQIGFRFIQSSDMNYGHVLSVHVKLTVISTLADKGRRFDSYQRHDPPPPQSKTSDASKKVGSGLLFTPSTRSFGKRDIILHIVQDSVLYSPI